MDNRNIEEVRENETKLINKMKQLQQENQKYKEAIDKIMNILENDYLYNDGDFESRKFQNDILSVLSEVTSKFGRL